MEGRIHEHKSKLVFRYGIFFIFFVMLIGIVWIAEYYEVQVKQPVHIVVSEDMYKVYISKQSSPLMQKNDIILISQTSYGDFYLIVDSMYNEATFSVLLVSSQEKNDFQEKIQGDTYISGYLSLGREKVREMLLRKVQF